MSFVLLLESIRREKKLRDKNKDLWQSLFWILTCFSQGCGQQLLEYWHFLRTKDGVLKWKCSSRSYSRLLFGTGSVILAWVIQSLLVNFPLRAATTDWYITARTPPCL